MKHYHIYVSQLSIPHLSKEFWIYQLSFVRKKLNSSIDLWTIVSCKNISLTFRWHDIYRSAAKLTRLSRCLQYGVWGESLQNFVYLLMSKNKFWYRNICVILRIIIIDINRYESTRNYLICEYKLPLGQMLSDMFQTNFWPFFTYQSLLDYLITIYHGEYDRSTGHAYS